MADDFRAGVHRGDWWSTETNPACQEPAASASGDSNLATRIPFDHPSSMTGYGPFSTSEDWNQSFPSCNEGNVQRSIHALSTKSFELMYSDINTVSPVPASVYRAMDEAFLQDHQRINDRSVDSTNHNHGMYDNTWSRFSQSVRPSMIEKQQPAMQSHFSGGTPPLWNIADTTAGVYTSSLISQFIGQPVIRNATKPNTEAPTTMGKHGIIPQIKKQRVETSSSSVPGVKVRKEKLGDRITALQQLVSPFGKTDTASVLYEAIEYIKFLHDQVTVLSTPYLKNTHPTHHEPQINDKAKDGEVGKKDLVSKGLCLVPMSSTFAVANEPNDFWTPTFGGTFR